MRADKYQVGGDHYTSAVQPWTAMADWMPHQCFVGFLLGNAIKYLARAGRKGDALMDYRKAKHYLEKLIEVEEEFRRDADQPLAADACVYLGEINTTMRR